MLEMLYHVLPLLIDWRLIGLVKLRDRQWWGSLWEERGGRLWHRPELWWWVCRWQIRSVRELPVRHVGDDFLCLLWLSLLRLMDRRWWRRRRWKWWWGWCR